MNRGELLDRIADVIATGKAHPRGMEGILEDGERALGAEIIPLGATEPFHFALADWSAGVVSRLGNEVRIVAILAREPCRGAFARLVHGIQEAGLKPVVIEPVGEVMPAIMRRWKWKCTIRGRGWERVEEWRPPLGGRS